MGLFLNTALFSRSLCSVMRLHWRFGFRMFRRRFSLSLDFILSNLFFWHWCEDFDELILENYPLRIGIVHRKVAFFCWKAYAFSGKCHTSKSNPWCSLFHPKTIKSDILLNVKPVNLSFCFVLCQFVCCRTTGRPLFRNLLRFNSIQFHLFGTGIH